VRGAGEPGTPKARTLPDPGTKKGPEGPTPASTSYGRTAPLDGPPPSLCFNPNIRKRSAQGLTIESANFLSGSYLGASWTHAASRAIIAGPSLRQHRKHYGMPTHMSTRNKCVTSLTSVYVDCYPERVGGWVAQASGPRAAQIRPSPRPRFRADIRDASPASYCPLSGGPLFLFIPQV
jgi:hypothetical protein